MDKSDVVSNHIYEGIDFFGFIAGFIGGEIVLCGPWKLACDQWKVREFFLSL